MKKINLMIAISAISTLLMAGGDITPVQEKENSIKPCYENEATYVQEEKGLMWQDMKYTDREHGAYKRGKIAGKVGKANYAKNYCRNLNYAGYSDWRLPTSEELMSVYTYSERPFINWVEDNFWSSTPASNGKNYAIYATDGNRYEKKTTTSEYIRCVRCLND